MFEFLKYIQPLWYYRIAFDAKNLLLFKALANFGKKNISSDNRFSTIESQNMDLTYQALQMGFIPINTEVQDKEFNYSLITNRFDNYLFLSKYFAKNKLIYVFIIRILTFHNPILELYGLLKNINNRRIDFRKLHLNHEDYEPFESTLISENPLVTIVIPTLNRHEYLKDVFKDLEAQEYKNFEVIVCDQSEIIPDDFYENWNLNIRWFRQEEKALWLARNTCIEMSKSEYILLFDDDSRVEPDWIINHLKCMDFFGVSISAGVTHTLIGHGLGIKESYFHLSDVFDTGNSLVKRSVFRKIGLFDRQFEKQRMGDGEFGIRAILNEFQIISNPFAKRVHLKVETGGLRQMGSWDGLRPKKLFAPRPVPSVLYLARKYFGLISTFYYLILNIPFTFIPYKFKNNKPLKLLFLILIPLLFPIMVSVVLKSWIKSSEKLNIGHKISVLKV